jgi:hypothetical protein
MFLYQLAPKLNSEKAIFNMMCSAAVSTVMGSDVPYSYLHRYRAGHQGPFGEGGSVAVVACCIGRRLIF